MEFSEEAVPTFSNWAFNWLSVVYPLNTLGDSNSAATFLTSLILGLGLPLPSSPASNNYNETPSLI
jgi:hypothetical protein